jgi:hypothetical protein
MSEHISTSSDKAALDKNPNHESISHQIREVFGKYNPMYLKERAVLDTLCESAQGIMLPPNFFDRIKDPDNDGSLHALGKEARRMCDSAEVADFTDYRSGFADHCHEYGASLADIMKYTLTLAHCAPETVKYLDVYWSDLFEKSNWPTRKTTEELRGDCRTWFGEHEQEVATLLHAPLTKIVADAEILDKYGTDILVNGTDRMVNRLLGDVEGSIESLPFSEACRNDLLKKVKDEILATLNDEDNRNIWLDALEDGLWSEIRWGEQGGGLLLEYDDGYSYEDVISWLKKRRKVLPGDWEDGEDFKQHIMRLEQCGEAVETLDGIANARLEELGIRLSEPDHRLPKRSWEFPEGSPRQKMAKDYEERFDTVNSPEELRHVVENIDPAYSEYVRERFADTVRAASDPQVIIDRLLNEDRYDIRTRINPLWMLRNTLQILLPRESDDLVQEFGIERKVEKLRRHNDDVYSQLGEEEYQRLSDDSLAAEIACRIIDDMCGDDHELYDAIMVRVVAHTYEQIHKKQGVPARSMLDRFAVFINHTNKIKFPIDLPDGEAVLRAISPDETTFSRCMQI